MAATYDAIVIGSGLAGLSAAFELAERRQKVLVLEAARQVGGRTSNWKEKGMDVESGLHKFVGVYREFPRLLRRAGLDLGKVFVYQDEIEIRVAEGGDRNHDPQRRRRSGRFGLSVLHRPLLTIGGALGNGELLPWRDKLRLAYVFLAGILDYLRDPDALDRTTHRGLRAEARREREPRRHRVLLPVGRAVLPAARAIQRRSLLRALLGVGEALLREPARDLPRGHDGRDGRPARGGHRASRGRSAARDVGRAPLDGERERDRRVGRRGSVPGPTGRPGDSDRPGPEDHPRDVRRRASGGCGDPEAPFPAGHVGGGRAIGARPPRPARRPCRLRPQFHPRHLRRAVAYDLLRLAGPHLDVPHARGALSGHEGRGRPGGRDHGPPTPGRRRRDPREEVRRRPSSLGVLSAGARQRSASTAPAHHRSRPRPRRRLHQAALHLQHGRRGRVRPSRRRSLASGWVATTRRGPILWASRRPSAR